MFRVHLPKALVTLQGKGRFVGFPIFFQRFVVIEILLRSLGGHGFVQGRHGNVHMAFENQLRHKTVKQGQQQGGDVGSVHVRIRHDNDLVVAQLFDVEIIAVALGKSASEGIDHGLDLRIGQHLVDACLFHIQNLAPDGKDCLEHAVSCHLGAASGGISLHNKDLALGRVPGFAVGQFSVGIKGEFLLGQHIGPGPFLGLADFSRLLRAAYDIFQGFQVPVKEADDLLSRYLGHHLGRVLIVQFCFGLSFKPWVRVLDGHHRSHAVPHIGSRKVGVLFLQNTGLPGVGIDHVGKHGLEAGEMGSALGIVDIVAEAQDIFVKFVNVLEGNLHRDSLALSLEVDDLMDGFLGFVYVLYESGDAVRLMEGYCLRIFSAPVLEKNCQVGV